MNKSPPLEGKGWGRRLSWKSRELSFPPQEGVGNDILVGTV